MDYITFDVVRFLRDARKWEQKIKELDEKYKELSQFNDLCLMNGETVMVTKEKIRLEVQQIQDYQKALDTALFKLNGKEKEAIMGFFFSDTPVADFVEKWAKKYHSNARYCYYYRQEVIEKMAKTLLEYYE